MMSTRSLKNLRILFLSLLILLLAGVVMFAAPWKSLAIDDAADEVAAVDEGAGDEAVIDETVADEAEPQDGGYGVWVGGVEINASNCWNIVDAINTYAGTTVATGWAGYDVDRQTLYLEDLDYSGAGWTKGWTGKIPGIGDATCAIYSTHNLTIVTDEDCEILFSPSSALDGYSRFGVYVNGNLYIKSTSYYDDIAFTVDSVPSTLTDCGIYALYANNIEFDGIYVSLHANQPSPGFPSYGVYATQSFKIGFDAWFYANCYTKAMNRKPAFTADAYRPFVSAGAYNDVTYWSEKNASSYGYTDQGIFIGMEPSFKRLAGADRYATGAAITDVNSNYGEYWASAVILATGKDYPDALCASALAGRYGAPIVMVEPGRLPASSAQALKNLHPDYIFVVGGTGAVSDSVVQAARSLTGVPSDYVFRFSGLNRYETGLAIYEGGGLDGGDTCIIATGGNFADALSISPYAYATATPIFLADAKTHKLNDQVVAALSGEGFTKIIIVGGTGVVSDDVADQLGVDPANVVRLFGNDRYATSMAIAKWELKDYDSGDYAFGPTAVMYPDNISVATGTGFADALAGGVLCGYYRAPLLLVGSSASSYAGAVDLLSSIKDDYIRGYVFGGTGAVSAAVKGKLDAALQPDSGNGFSLLEEGQENGLYVK